MSTNTTEPPADANIDHDKALTYWSGVDPDVNGMLGGFPQISRLDIQGSKNFIAKLRRDSQTTGEEFARGVDCGAGIGRITLSLLSSICKTTDVVEPIAKFTSHILSDPSFAQLRSDGSIGAVYTQSLESWAPPPDVRYDLVWNQWCLGHLTDAQLVAYLKVCVGALLEGGWVVVKENLSTDAGGDDIFDQVDNSVTRADKKFRGIFAEAGLRVARTELQKGFPKGLYPVRIYALQPAKGQR
ncbi:hypothetical protein FGG08_006013 [Glutinoglossum americanum]|uniref:Alpha N-terminal protein methyltransferase 1 n=1 Tax=Glutinoglossum americanum TaxID=1670608 RepID=A0A9P8I257_9PEZI|nr:hypothetical protein FGG08_006013 [Glutinoglossum americanum]